MLLLRCGTIFAFLPLIFSAASVSYTYQDLGRWEPAALNNRGWAVGAGQRSPDSAEYPLRYRPGIGLEFISDLRGELFDINYAGTAVGWLAKDGFNAIVRPAGQPWTAPYTGPDLLVFRKINEAGQIAGSTSPGPSFTIRRAALYSPALGFVDLHPPEASPHSEAVGINEAGQVLVWTYGAVFHTYIYDIATKTMTDLTPAVSAVTGDPWFLGRAINDAGVVAGRLTPTGSPLVLYDPVEGVRRIGRIGNYVEAAAINNRGWVVGRFGRNDTRFPTGAFLYVRGQGIQNLEDLITGAPLKLRSAVGINESGEILVYGHDNHAYLLSRIF